MYRNILEIALKGLALAMGVTVIVLGALKTLDMQSGIAMLGLGLTALTLADFRKLKART